MNRLVSLDYDFDLFTNFRGFYIHYATAGGYIPEKIVSDPHHHQTRSFLLNQAFDEYEFKINPNISNIIELKLKEQNIGANDFNREEYLKDFISYAKKGCFSFDRTFISDRFNKKYHLVAYPFLNNEQLCELGLSNNYIDEIVCKHFNMPRRIFY